MKWFTWTFSSFILLCIRVGVALAEPAAYLDLDPGARSLGMGSAFVALADDTNASFFNPAGLANMGIRQFEVGGAVGFLNDSQYHNFLSACQQLPPNSYIGFHVIQYGVSDLSHDPSVTSSLSDSEWDFASSWAYEVSYQFQVGIGISYLYQNLVGLNAHGFGGADVGVLFIPSLMYDITLGASVCHLGGFLSWDTGTTEYLNPDLRLGVSEKLFQQSLVLGYEAEWQTQTNFYILQHAGVEWWMWKFLAFRGGWDQNTPTAGLTVRWTNYSLDYSIRFQDYGNQGSMHRLALDYTL